VIDLVAAFSAVAAALDSAGADYVVVGSTAAASWGSARATRDVDVVAVLPALAIDRLLAELAHESLYVRVEDARRAAEHGGSFNVLHPASGGKVDVFVALADDDFTASRLGRRVRAEVLGVATWIATPEDVVLAKLRWRSESRSEVQWRDCVEIAATQSLDTGYMRTWAPRLGVSDDLDDLLSPE
jgi:hypothetical protein